MIDTCLFGDCRESMREMIAAGVKVQCAITSPPYWGLRDYGVEGQLGLESTPDEYIGNMVEVFRLVRDLLADDGCLWLNLGDSFLEKQLVGIPRRVAFALQADGWFLRSDIIWHKPNPMPESVTDRPTKAHEYLFLLAKRSSYYYDADAIRETTGNEMSLEEHESRLGKSFGGTIQTRFGIDKHDGGRSHPNGRNRRTVWTVATEPFAGSHFATFPRALIEPCILAGTSQKGHCPGCGKGWVRVVETEFVKLADRKPTRKGLSDGVDPLRRDVNTHEAMGYNKTSTLGWQPSCACNLEPVPGIVFDPFLGSGTTGQVAQDLGRHWLGCELQQNYAKLQTRRTEQLGMALA